jgi:sugar O-acyltransferase (sialic acid O-acetyltransferase NeuD family)
MRILLMGASGHARVIIDMIERTAEHQIVGLIAESSPNELSVCGYPIVGDLQDLRRLACELRVERVIAAIGDNWSRSEVVRRAYDSVTAIQFVAVAHPSTQIARHVEIGAGTALMAGSIVNSGARIGKHCVVNTKASVDHDCVIGDFASIAPGATLGGNVRVGEFSAVSLGANVIHGVTVGAHTVIGAGSVVVNDVPDCAVAYGVPARVVRKRSVGERYL